jgi:superfamily II DNA/RNA helicase
MVRLDQTEILVLDEADRMSRHGIFAGCAKNYRRCPRNRQTLLFSATIPPEIEQLCRWALRNPESIEIGQRRSPAETVTHALYPVDIGQKQELLEELLRRTEYDQVLIFCRTKNGADRVARKLHQEGHAVAVLHSSRTQRERENALAGFRNGRYEVMVATDIAARGIDVEQISHVINFDVPHHPEDSCHRIGRTGRAQSVGDAFTIMTAEDLQEVAAIERFIGQKIPRVKLDGFDYAYCRCLIRIQNRLWHSVGRRSYAPETRPLVNSTRMPMKPILDLPAFVHAAGDAIIAAGADGRIIFWNPAATRIFGFSEVEALGQSLDLIIPERFRARHWEGIARSWKAEEQIRGRCAASAGDC